MSLPTFRIETPTTVVDVVVVVVPVYVVVEVVVVVVLGARGPVALLQHVEVATFSHMLSSPFP